MLVKFISTETGELVMTADLARALLHRVGKECSALGVFVPAEMDSAAATLKADAAASRQVGYGSDEEEEAARIDPTPDVSQRAWPLIRMLERTAASGPEAHIRWEADADFEVE
jgi:hypothetical protein